MGVVSLIMAAAIAGCNTAEPSASTANSPSLAASPPATPEATSSPEPSLSPDPTSSIESESGEVTPPPTEPETTTGPTVLDPSVVGRELKLADIFKAEGEWTEQRYDVADRPGVFALGAPVQCSYSGVAGTSLELRLANRFSPLKFQVGQANNSASSDGELTVDVIANSTAKRDNRVIPFNKVQDFVVDVGGVGALKVLFSLPCENNQGSSVVAVVQGITASAGG